MYEGGDDGGVKAAGGLSVVRVTMGAFSIVFEVRGILAFGFFSTVSRGASLMENNVLAMAVAAMMDRRTHMTFSRFQ